MREIQVKTPLDLSGAPTATLPRDVRPMLATAAQSPFRRAGWIFEIKWDGYRALTEISGSTVRMQSRNGNALNDRFAGLIGHLAGLGHEAVLDGELVVLDPQGVAQFEWLQNYPRYGGQLVYFVFDILYLDGHDLTEWPLLRRKQLLKQIVPTSPHLKYCDHIDTDGELFFEAIKQRGVEGIVAKDGSSLYLPGRRSKRWLKIKVHSRQQAVIAGYKEGNGARQQLGSLVLGAYRDATLVHVGEVGTGLTESSTQSILDQLKSLVQRHCPFDKKPKIQGRVRWVKPTLLCEVKFQSWTMDGKMRQPVWLGLCDDRAAQESEVQPPVVQRKKPLPRSTASVSIAGRALALTNLDKIYWPKEQLVKRDLVAYYREVAPFILPYLQDRPVSLHRYPDGVEGQSFFQKDIRKAPDWVRTVAIRHDSREKSVNYALCQDEATLVYVANLGSIELHPWHSRAATLGHPDYLVIDLDPADTPFSQVIDAALAVRAIMDEAGGACWCKTSGQTGLHVVVPLGTQYEYGQAAQFANLVVRLINQRLPRTTSLDRNPARRRKLVYLDSLQNRRGQTIACVYAPRAHPGALVSTPLKWSEVTKNLDPSLFTIRSVGKRLTKFGDLWAGVMGPGIDMLDCLNRLPRLLQCRR